MRSSVNGAHELGEWRARRFLRRQLQAEAQIEAKEAADDV
jgi:hypothetical protein